MSLIARRALLAALALGLIVGLGAFYIHYIWIDEIFDPVPQLEHSAVRCMEPVTNECLSGVARQAGFPVGRLASSSPPGNQLVAVYGSRRSVVVFEAHSHTLFVMLSSQAIPFPPPEGELVRGLHTQDGGNEIRLQAMPQGPPTWEANWKIEAAYYRLRVSARTLGRKIDNKVVAELIDGVEYVGP
jgi:hypothetical protein